MASDIYRWVEVRVLCAAPARGLLKQLNRLLRFVFEVWGESLRPSKSRLIISDSKALYVKTTAFMAAASTAWGVC